MLDMIIEGGVVIDGTGAPARPTDVGIVQGRVAALGDLSGVAAPRRLDAAGRVVSPGFIDLHTHCGFDPKHYREGGTMNYLQQGVTTVVGGNCGFSPTDFHDVLDQVAERKDGPNLALMVGHNSVRLAVLGQQDRPPTDDELGAMERLVAEAMELGAIAFSSGLYYVPGCYAATEEVIALAKTAARYGGFYATHMRTESDQVEAALAEAIRVGRESGLPVQVSHHKVAGVLNWGKSEQTLALIDGARAVGVDIIPDQYPYTASCARIGALLPRWVCAGGDEQARARLQDPVLRPKIKAEVADGLRTLYGGELHRIRIASSVIRPDLAGKTFADIATEAVDSCEDMAEFAMDLAKDRPASCDTMCTSHTMSEEDLARIMVYPHTLIASDGWAVQMGDGHPHPRLYGTFPRVLGRYCREKQLLPLEVVVRKMTSMPAARLGIRDRGVLKQGTHADVTVFNFDTISDTATFDDPHRYPVGIDYVLVNGEVVLDHGAHTGALPGVFIPRPE